MRNKETFDIKYVFLVVVHCWRVNYDSMFEGWAIRSLSLFYTILDRDRIRTNSFAAVLQSRSLFTLGEDAKLPVTSKQVDNSRDFYFLGLKYNPLTEMMTK